MFSLLGRARRSRDGLMESRLHRRRCHAGPPPHPAEPPWRRTPHPDRHDDHVTAITLSCDTIGVGAGPLRWRSVLAVVVVDVRTKFLGLNLSLENYFAAVFFETTWDPWCLVQLWLWFLLTRAVADLQIPSWRRSPEPDSRQRSCRNVACPVWYPEEGRNFVTWNVSLWNGKKKQHQWYAMARKNREVKRKHTLWFRQVQSSVSLQDLQSSSPRRYPGLLRETSNREWNVFAVKMEDRHKLRRNKPWE